MLEAPPTRPAMFVLSTPEPARVMDFYRSLLGWELQPMAAFPSGGDLASDAQVFVVRGGEVGWLPFLPVADLAGLVERARNAGANRVVFPLPDDDTGRSAAIIDPTGARLGLLAIEGTVPKPDPAPLAPGRVVWIEEKTRDHKAAAAFQEAVFGLQAQGPGGAGEVQVLRGGGAPYSAIMQFDERWDDDYPPRWLIYACVADLEATLAQAVEYGGSVWFSRTETELGPLAYLRDPDGNGLAVVEVSHAARALLAASDGQVESEPAGSGQR